MSSTNIELSIAQLNRLLCKYDLGRTFVPEADEYVSEAYYILRRVEEGQDFAEAVKEVHHQMFDGLELSQEIIDQFVHEYFNPVVEALEIDETPWTPLQEILFINHLSEKQFEAVKQYLAENG